MGLIVIGVTTVLAVPADPVHFSALQAELKSIDPLLATDTNTQLIVNNAFDGLVMWDSRNGIQPGLAVSWEISSDKLTYTFHLRPEAKFQDGSPVLSRDVCLHFQNLLGKPSYFQDHYKVIKNVACPEPHRVSLQLSRAYPDIFLLLSGVGAKIVKRNPDGSIVGAGPFEPHLGKREIRLTRAASYWGKIPSVREIRFAVLDETDAIGRLNRGELDDMSLIPFTGSEITSREGRYIVQPMWATWVVGLDERVPPLNRQDVRQELVDRLSSKDFVKNVYPDQEAAAGLIPFGIPGFLEAQPNSSPKRDFRRHFPAEVEVFIPDMLVKGKQIGQWIETSMQGSWVKVRVALKPFEWMIEHYAKGTMGAYFLSINAEYPDPSFLFRSLTSSSSSNFLGVRNSELDALINQIEQEPPGAQRVNLSREVNYFLNQRAASVNLVHVRHRAWAKHCVDGIRTSPVSEGYTDYRHVVNRCR